MAQFLTSFLAILVLSISATKRDVLRIDALDQWCLRKLLGIKWYHYVRNDEVRRTTGQPRLSAIVQARRLSVFGHIARMPDETDARNIITASPLENWRRPPGRPRTTWMKTIQQDLTSNNLSLDEAITVAQNRPLWRLMSAFGATHPWWCMPHKKKKKNISQVIGLVEKAGCFALAKLLDGKT